MYDNKIKVKGDSNFWLNYGVTISRFASDCEGEEKGLNSDQKTYEFSDSKNAQIFEKKVNELIENYKSIKSI